MKCCILGVINEGTYFIDLRNEWGDGCEWRRLEIY